MIHREAKAHTRNNSDMAPRNNIVPRDVVPNVFYNNTLGEQTERATRQIQIVASNNDSSNLLST